MLIPIAIEFFAVGRKVAQTRRNLVINATTSNTRKIAEIREGLLESGKDFMDSPLSKRLFRDIGNYSSKGEDPKVRLGTRRGGYNTLRDTGDIYRFIAVLEQESTNLRSSTKLRIIVNGYTDRAELDRDGLPDLDTVMHINSISTYRVKDGGLRGEDTFQSVSNQMVVLPYRKGVSSGETEFLSTPSLLSKYADECDDGMDDKDFSKEMIVDTDGVYAKTLRQGSVNPDKFLSNLTRCEYDASIDQDNVIGSGRLFDHSTGLSQSTFTSHLLANKQIDNSLTANSFYDAFTCSVDRTEELALDLRRDAGFTLEDLMEACSIRERDMSDYIFVVEFENNNFDVESWRSADENTMAAYDICFRIPEIMIENQIKGCSFRVSNHGSRLSSRVEPEFMFLEDYNERGDESYNVVPVSGTGDIPLYFLEKFEDEIISDVFEPLSDYGNIPLVITVHSSLGGITKVDIAFDDNEEEPYVFYSFMESRLNHTINYTGDDNFNDLVGDYHSLRSEVNAVTKHLSKMSAKRTLEDDGLSRSSLARKSSLSSTLINKDKGKVRRSSLLRRR